LKDSNCQSVSKNKTQLYIIYEKPTLNTKTPIKKWATELNKTFSKEEIQMAKNT
jgi:hypothetical protein